MTTYKDAGVDISAADAAKKAMAKSIDIGDPRVLNRHGAFASLVQGSFPGYRDPVLVLKTEEPGSKQKIAFEHKRIRSICADTVNHLVNDIAVMGANPLYVQDAVICGKLEKEIVMEIVAGFSETCRAQGCVLTGGETSEQPGVLPEGTYILTTSIVGVVEKESIIDGSRIRTGDIVLALGSSGLHTNGYTLVRKLMEKHPEILEETIDGKSFLDIILEPHRCYFQALRGLFGHPELKGLAHITGGGIGGNLNRILPEETQADIDLGNIPILPIFSLLRRIGNIPDDEMLKTFNLGVGITAVVSKEAMNATIKHMEAQGIPCTPIGEITKGAQEVAFRGALRFK